MTKEEVFSQLKEVLQVVRPAVDLSEVTYETELVSGLGIDSLSMLLISLAIEDKLQIRFDNAAPFVTVGDVCDYALTKLS